MNGRIVITGVGLLGPAGIGLEPLRELLKSSEKKKKNNPRRC